MDLKLKNKTALVTGSTAGIGFAIAQLLAEEGGGVGINGRTQARVDAAIAKITSKCASARLIPLVADLSNPREIEAIANEVPVIDILVNNFGIYELKAFNDISDDDWLRLFNANVMSGIRLSRYYLPKMLKNDWGRILFISSESGLQIPAEMVHYGMTKAAQIAIARGMAETTAGSNVTVNCVLPGPTRSEGVNQFVEQLAKEQNKPTEQIEKELFTTMRPSSLLKRFIEVEEVASMVGFICSPLSSATNGAAIRVEGGIVRSIG